MQIIRISKLIVKWVGAEQTRMSFPMGWAGCHSAWSKNSRIAYGSARTQWRETGQLC